MTEAATHDEDDGFEWAIVEIFGHRRHAGRAIEVERFGAKLLRIDIPKITFGEAPGGEEPEQTVNWVTHFYGGSSIFSYTLTDEDSVMKLNRPYRPAQRYLAPPDPEEDAADYDPESDMPW